MIFDRVLWFPSTLPGTRWLLIKDERKRMKAFGGRGMYDASRFFAWEARAEGGMGGEGLVLGGAITGERVSGSRRRQ